MLHAELVEHADDRAPQLLAPVGVVGRRDRGDQPVEAALLLAGVERGEGGGDLGVVLEPQPGGEALGAERARELGEDRERVLALAAVGEDAGEGEPRVGPPRLELERAAQVLLAPDSTSASASDGSSSSRNRATAAGGCAPVNSETTAPSLNALTAGMPWIRNAPARRWFASVSSFASAIFPPRSFTAASSTGASWRHGPHHSAQKSTTTGSVRERSTTSARRWPRRCRRSCL